MLTFADFEGDLPSSTRSGTSLCIFPRSPGYVTALPDWRAQLRTPCIKRLGVNGLQWVMPDDPLTALPLTIFMRPYYEPRLLPRLLDSDDFKKSKILPHVEYDRARGNKKLYLYCLRELAVIQIYCDD